MGAAHQLPARGLQSAYTSGSQTQMHVIEWLGGNLVLSELIVGLVAHLGSPAFRGKLR